MRPLALIACVLVGCGEGAAVSSDASVPPGLRLSLRDDGRVDFAAGGVNFDGGDFVVRYPDGREAALSTMQRTAFSADRASYRGPDGTAVTLVRTCATDRCALTWTIDAGPVVRGIELRLPPRALAADARVVVEGAQSWSFAGAIKLAPGTLLPRDSSGAVRFSERLGDSLADLPNLSIAHALLASGSTRLSLCAGRSDRVDRWTAIAFERPDTRTQVRVFDGLQRDETLTPGDPMRPARGEIHFALGDTGDVCAAPMIRSRPPSPWPRGWWSWNTLFSRVSAADIDRQLAALSPIDPGAHHVTLDDGWERLWGDWRERPEFGATLRELATTLRARGITLGLWLAPFAVDPAAPLATEHPAWMLHDTAGAVLQQELVPGHRYMILDATNPEARAHITATLRGLREAGVSLFKVDFLYAQALPAVRSDPSVSGLAAYTLGMQAIAAGAGDAHINGCGAILLPTLPYVDSVRIGADNTFDGVAPFRGSITAAARNLVARGWIQRFGVAIDPDQPVTRGLAPDEGRAFVALGLLSGAFGYGDDLTALTPDALARYREPWIEALRDSAPTELAPLDAADNPASAYLTTPVVDSLGSARENPRARAPSVITVSLSQNRRAAALFNWTDESVDVGVPSGVMVMPREIVANETVRATAGGVSVRVPPRGVRVLVGPRGG